MFITINTSLPAYLLLKYLLQSHNRPNLSGGKRGRLRARGLHGPPQGMGPQTIVKGRSEDAVNSTPFQTVLTREDAGWGPKMLPSPPGSGWLTPRSGVEFCDWNWLGKGDELDQVVPICSTRKTWNAVFGLPVHQRPTLARFGKPYPNRPAACRAFEQG